MELTSGSTSMPTSPSPSSASKSGARRSIWRRRILHAEHAASQDIGQETLDASTVASHRGLADGLRSARLQDGSNGRRVDSSAQV